MEGDCINKVLFALCKGCVEDKNGPISVSPISTQSQASQVFEASSQAKNTNVPSEDNVETPITKVCRFYLQKKCRHFAEKTTCPFSHPKLCHGWTKKGRCTDKSKCSQYYHPKLCDASINGVVCNMKKCYL